LNGTKRILIYRRGALGDTLFLYPLFETLKRKGFYVVVAGNTDYLQLARKLNWIDEAYTELFPEVVERPYFRKLLFTKGSLPPFPQKRQWIVEHYFQVSGIEPKFSEELPLEPAKKSPLKGKFVLHPGSGSPKKNPPLELFLKIEVFLKEKGYSVVYFEGIADTWLEGKVKPIFKCEDISELATHLKAALGFIGNDSGISQLAAYLGIPSFLFFGPTDPVVWRPLGKNWQILYSALPCSPCFPKTCQKRPCLNPEILFPLFTHAFKEKKPCRIVVPMSGENE